jgi:hypothetical protein
LLTQLARGEDALHVKRVPGRVGSRNDDAPPKRGMSDDDPVTPGMVLRITYRDRRIFIT